MVLFNFYSNFNRTFCKETVDIPTRRRILRYLIFVCAVCLCPKKHPRLICVNMTCTCANIIGTGETSRQSHFVHPNHVSDKYCMYST